MSKTFKQFVLEQPDDRPIDHSDGWTNCAVGDYARDQLGEKSDQNDVFDFIYKPIKIDPIKYIVGDDYIYNLLSNSDHNENLGTYGDLKELYKAED